jgi:hypothetical protein
MSTVAIVATFLVVLLSSSPLGPVTVWAEDGEVEQLRTELNETKAQLAKAEKDRDEFAQRLEDSTMVLVTTLALLIVSYFIFFLTNRRQRVVLEQLRAEAGITLESPQPKRKPRRRRG